MSMCRLLQRCWTWGFCCFLACACLHAEKGAQWRVFRLGDGYPASVSVSPKGTIWAVRADTSLAHWFDGYATGQVSLPATPISKIYESRSSQLWAVYPEG